MHRSVAKERQTDKQTERGERRTKTGPWRQCTQHSRGTQQYTEKVHEQGAVPNHPKPGGASWGNNQADDTENAHIKCVTRKACGLRWLG